MLGKNIIKKFNWHEFCPILPNHFHKGVGKNAPDTVQILEQIDGNERAGIGALDASIT